MDLVTLGLRVDSSGAVIATKQLDTSLKDLAKSAEGTVSPLDRMTKKIEESRLRYAAWQRQLAADVATQRAIDQAKMMHAEMDGAAGGVGRLRGAVTSLAASSLSSAPGVAQLGSAVGMLALGGPTTVAVLLGLAAIGYAHNKLTADTRKDREEQEHYIDSLRKQAQAAKDASVSGSQARVDQARKIEADAIAAAQRFNETGGGPSWQASKVTGRVTSATADRILAEANAAKVLAGVEEEIRKANFANEVRYAGEQKQLLDDRTAAAKKADEAALARLKAYIDTLKNSPMYTTNFGAGVSAAIDARGPVNLDRREATATGGALLTYQQREAVNQFQFMLTGGMKPATETFVANTHKMSDVMHFAAQSIGSSAAQLVIGKISGGGIASTVGGGIGQAGASQLGGFGGTAYGQAIFQPIFAAIGAKFGEGVQKLANDLFGGGSAAREHAFALKEAQRVFTDNLGAFHAAATGTTGSLEEMERQVHATAAAMRAQQIANNPSAGSWWNVAGAAALAAQLAAINAEEAIYVAHLKQEAALKAKYYDEDLDVRLLRAQGHASQADKLAFDQKQDRERQALIDSFGPTIDAMEAERLAKLNLVLAAEKLRQTFNDLTTSFRNAPSSFKIGGYINRYAEPRPWGSGPDLPSRYNPFSYPRPGTSGAPAKPAQTVVHVSMAGATFDLGDSKTPREHAVLFVQGLRQIAAVTVGGNAPLAEALDWA